MGSDNPEYCYSAADQRGGKAQFFWIYDTNTHKFNILKTEFTAFNVDTY